jgi:hypothetical protein
MGGEPDHRAVKSIEREAARADVAGSGRSCGARLR